MNSRISCIFPLSTLAVVLLANALPAQEANEPTKLEEEIDRYLAPYIEMRDFSGTVLISKGGEVVLNKGYGFANLEHSVRHSHKSRFHIASISKTFTAAAILKLAEMGKLSLDDDLQKFDFNTKENITIKQLLMHQSGIPDFWNLSGVDELMVKENNTGELAAWLLEQPLVFKPGQRHEYSNSGYLILARIIEIVTEKKFENALTDLVLEPAGLNNTGHIDENRIIKNRVAGYDPGLPPHGLVNTAFLNKSLLIGSGSLYSTTGDLFKWYNVVRDNSVVDWSAVEYPYGWGQRRIYGRVCTQQSGRNPGCASHISTFLKDDVCIIVLSNIQCDVVKIIQRDLAAIVFGHPYKIPKIRKAIPIEAAALEAMEGHYRLTESSTLTIKRFDDALFLKSTNGPYLPLEALGENEFFYRALYAKINFARNEEGEITKLLWGGSYECAKLD